MSTEKGSDAHTETDCPELKNELSRPEFGVSQILYRSDQDSNSYTPPTVDEWKTMKAYGRFITHDEDDVEHTFRVHDRIYVLPAGMSPEAELDPKNLWIAEIRAIRAHDNESVWIKAKWFYHPAELPKNVRGATGKLGRFGLFERISSNRFDFIPTSSCCGIATIKPFDEQDMEQEAVEEDTLFYSYDYDWRTRKLKESSPPCSICKKAYNPGVDVMHFCPRAQCCRSWHTQCLAGANWVITSPIDLPQRFESFGDRAEFAETRGERRNLKKIRDGSLSAPLPRQNPYANVPQELLVIARQPIVRGGALGIVGNVRSVVRARKMLQVALNGLGKIPEDWKQQLGKVYITDLIPQPKQLGKGKVKGRGKGATALAYQCPKCGEPI